MIDPSPAEERNYNRLFEALKEETKDVSGPVKSILSRRMSPKYALVMCGVTAHVGKRHWTPDQSQEVVNSVMSMSPGRSRKLVRNPGGRCSRSAGSQRLAKSSPNVPEVAQVDQGSQIHEPSVGGV
ncbi:C-5 cytosine methyltransferase [Penicillium sp. DV-2018c]|nr:C-5 cytosine methyltransferase [Penicillium sp. DV-2018c]KAJ5542913.1 C-5 cytosine methyltransferase [Penicillium sp. DV-2018c]KAJ5571665.1 C-5 cytosine methyltransferase [Penicillium sp. DV-2018c]KAJ5571675.1 C-5 cytosine methyltransferase [Penicillium sp. DV-2018c]